MGTRNFNTKYTGVLITSELPTLFEDSTEVITDLGIQVGKDNSIANIENLCCNKDQEALALDEMGGEFYLDWGYYDGVQITFRNNTIEDSPVYDYLNLPQMVNDVMNDIAYNLELELLQCAGAFSDGTGLYTTVKPEVQDAKN